MNKFFRITATTIMIAALLLATGSAASSAPVEPPTVEATLKPGEALTVTKTVSVPEHTPKLDLFLLVDLTGSYSGDLPNIKALAPGIFDAVRAGVPDSHFGLGSFRDFPFWDWGDLPDWAYRLDQGMTADKTTWLNAVNAMVAGGGADGPESQYEALFQTASGAGRDINGDGDYADWGEVAPGLDPSFRADATKAVAITTDATFHKPGDSSCYYPSPPCPFGYPGPSRNDTVNALNAAGITVIAIKAPGSGSQMDDVAVATGGVVKTTGSSSAEIAEAILSAIEELTFDITGNPVNCSPLQISFVPDVHYDVPGGAIVEFQETIAVPDDVSKDDLPEDGIVNCSVEFKAGDAVIGLQELWITVPLEIEVPVDIKPGSCPNPLNVTSKGVLPAAILGTADLNVAQIDPASVRLVNRIDPENPALNVAPLRWSMEDVATPYVPFVGKGGAYDCNEYAADGYLDLSLKFDTQEVVAALGVVNDQDVLVLQFVGNLQEEYGGTPIVGEDVVIVLKKK